ncbi:MAG: aspartate/glutamate racemase family protein [Sphingomonas sp.]|nr:aspartate/glutamate racemase family protein [Sphingomonas sp.]
MQIGLIGGIGPAAQDYYCRQLISLFAQAERSLDMTIVHADTPTLLANLAADRRTEQAELFAQLAERLDRAGAGLIGVTSIAGHFCRHEFAARSPLPVVDMIDAVAGDVAEHHYEKIGILGTRTVMESRFYGGLAGVDVIAPPGSALDDVHTAYVEMAKTGMATAAQRTIFHNAATHMINSAGAQAIMLGGTDLALAFGAETCPFPLIDCAAIHARAIFKKALG